MTPKRVVLILLLCVLCAWIASQSLGIGSGSDSGFLIASKTPVKHIGPDSTAAGTSIDANDQNGIEPDSPVVEPINRPSPHAEPREAKSGRYSVEDFLAPDNKPLFMRSSIEQHLTEKDLPFLYSALEDDKFALQWPNALLAICVLENSAAALDAVERFVSKPWDWRRSHYSNLDASRILSGRLIAVRNAAMIDTEFSGPFLTSMLSPELANEFLQEVRQLPLPMEGSSFDDTLAKDFQFGVASGLLHTRSAELFAHVEGAFRALALRERGDPKGKIEDIKVLAAYAKVMGERDLYIEKGWEEGILYLSNLDKETKVNRADASVRKYLELAHEIQNAK